MNGRQLNIEMHGNDWQEGFDEDYAARLDHASMKMDADKRSEARLKIEALREKKQLDEYLYDVFDDSDALN